MASEIGMDRKAGIHVPLDDSKIICRQVELAFSRAIDAVHEADQLVPVILIVAVNSGAENWLSRGSANQGVGKVPSGR
jgi:hypothetical protein